jgi:hypothetical protein
MNLKSFRLSREIEVAEKEFENGCITQKVLAWQSS